MEALFSTLKMALRVLCEVHYISHKYFPQMFLPFSPQKRKKEGKKNHKLLNL